MTDRFVNREEELQRLEAWWDHPGARLGLVWGRRRVGKTALLHEFARGHRSIFHTGAGRPLPDELALLSRAAEPVIDLGLRKLTARPFSDWDEAFEALGAAARDEPLLLVLDEFPELVSVAPDLPGRLRAFWDRAREDTRLRILLCGSAVTTMAAIQEERSPLYGRLDLFLLLHPFRPHEAAELLAGLRPADRALVWGICGGVPLYLSWWDQKQSLRENLASLVCTPGGALLSEGQLVLATEGEVGGLAQQVLRAIAAGRTKHGEIKAAVRAEPSRTLERLLELRLLERHVPVTEEARRTRLRLYRIADNFLAFWLGIVDRYRTEIERGLGRTILSVLIEDLDDYMGPRWEDAFRQHLRRLAAEGQLGEGVVAVGPFWTADGAAEIDAVVLAGRDRRAILLGEAKWAREIDGSRIRQELEAKARALPRPGGELTYAVAARERVRRADDLLAVTATDIFRPERTVQATTR